MERVVLDTSAWIEVERGKLDLVKVIGRDKKLFLPAIVAGELKQALFASSRSEARIQKALDFYTRVESMTEFAPMDQEVAQRYAELKHFSKLSGKPRGIADLVIAATAVELKAKLFSLDNKADFGSLPNVLLFS